MIFKRSCVILFTIALIVFARPSSVLAGEYPSYTVPRYTFSIATLFDKKETFNGTYHEYKVLPYSSKRWFVNSIPAGTERVGKPGVEGIKQISYSLGFEGTKLVKTQLSEKVILAPQQELIEVGTDKVYKVAKTDEGVEFQYLRTLYVRATSYDHTCLGCNKITATGRYLTKGIVAVDPKVIPLGTKMYVPGYGWGDAQDTGGAVKGNKIDLAFDDLRYGNWSTRWVTIYITEESTRKR